VKIDRNGIRVGYNVRYFYHNGCNAYILMALSLSSLSPLSLFLSIFSMPQCIEVSDSRARDNAHYRLPGNVVVADRVQCSIGVSRGRNVTWILPLHRCRSRNAGPPDVVQAVICLTFALLPPGVSLLKINSPAIYINLSARDVRRSRLSTIATGADGRPSLPRTIPDE
jgi:hypothetical protein